MQHVILINDTQPHRHGALHSTESPCACAFCKFSSAGFRDYVADFFTRSSVTRILSKDPSGPSEPKVLEIPYESLPRLLQLKYEHGLQEEHFLVKNAVETPVPGEHVGRSDAVPPSPGASTWLYPILCFCQTAMFSKCC